MASNPVPVLGTQGYVNDTASKFNQLMAWFMSSESSESYLFKGQIVSLPKIIQEHGNNEDRVVSAIREGITKLLSRYHERVSVVASSKASVEAGKRDQLEINLTVSVYDPQGDASQRYILRTSESMIQEVIRLNNTGA